jgi:hypothetical protein
METWQSVWRKGLAPRLSTCGLDALRQALLRDDGRLMQGATTSPPPLESLQDAPVEAACALGYCVWQGDGKDTVAEVNMTFEKICAAADEVVGEATACRLFLNWFDDTPRPLMRRQLLREVNRVLVGRRKVAA